MFQRTDSLAAVPAANRPPIAQNDYYIVPAGTALSGNVLANDYSPSGGELSAAKYGRPYSGKVSIADDGSFLFTPNSGFIGRAQFRYIATDETGKTDSALVDIWVVSYNQSPVAQSDSFATAQNTVLTGNLLTNDYDAEGTPLHAVPTTQTSSSYTMAIAADGSFVYTPAPGFTGSSSFVYTVTDGQQTDSGSISIQVVTPDQKPVAVSDNFAVGAGGVLAGNVLLNDYDPEGTALAANFYDYGGSPHNGTVTLVADGSFVYTPLAGFTGEDSFYYIVTDAYGQASGPGEVSVVIAQAGTVTMQPEKYYMYAGDTLSGNVLSNDYLPDDGGVTVVLGDYEPDFGSVALAEDGSFVYTASENFLLYDDRFDYRVLDAAGNILGEAWVQFSPLPFYNSRGIPIALGKPSVQKEYYYVAVDGRLAGDVLSNDYDPDGTPLSAAVLADPGHGSLALASDGSFAYIPQAGYNGVDEFIYSVSDAAGKTTLGRSEIRVGIPDAQPLTMQDAYYTDAGSELTGNVLANDYDPEGPDLKARLGKAPQYGELALNSDGSFSYVSDTGFVGGDYFYYIAIDPAGNASSEIVNILVGVPAVLGSGPV
jgi:hypothetical protein